MPGYAIQCHVHTIQKAAQLFKRFNNWSTSTIEYNVTGNYRPWWPTRDAASCIIVFIMLESVELGMWPFLALHERSVRTSDEKRVCLSVSLSITHVHCDKTEERYVQIFILYERPFSLVFWEEKGWWGDPFYLKFWINRPPLERIAAFSRYSLVAPQR